MSTSNRAAVITKIYKILKKHYKPVPTASRSVIEDLLYACCLEDAGYEAANDCFARLQESYFDWNEVRVTTVRELGEIFSGIPNATANALNLKNSLQSVFESQYSFDLEHLKKLNLGKAVAMLESYKGITQFTLAYVTQMSLGGHAIPLGKGGIDIMYIVGAIDAKEAAEGTVPGLERAIPKTKGPEFSSLLHQLAADLVASPFSPKTRAILLEIDPDCKPRLPKRVDKKKLEAERKKKEEEERKQRAAEAAAQKRKAEQEARAVAEKQAAAKKAAEKKSEAKKSARVTTTKKKVDKKERAAPTTAKRGVSKKKAAAKPAKKKKLVKKVAKKTSKKSASKQLARRKPR